MNRPRMVLPIGQHLLSSVLSQIDVLISSLYVLEIGYNAYEYGLLLASEREF